MMIKQYAVRFILTGSLLSLHLPGPSGPVMQRGQNQPPIVSRIDTLMKETFTSRAPGAAVLAVKRGEILFRKAYGLADVELSIPLTPDMVFGVGSVTKMFTAASIMILADSGKIRFQDRIMNYLDNAPPTWEEVTIDQLLSHTSGIIDLFQIPGWMAKWREDISPEELVRLFRDKPLQFKPGTGAAYCSSNYVLLGRIVEKVSGKSLDRFVSEEILDPLLLKNTHFGFRHTDIIPGRVHGYVILPNGTPTNPPFISFTHAYGAGDMFSTVDDIYSFVKALTGGEFLKPQTVERAFSPKKRQNEEHPYGYGNLFVFRKGSSPLIRISGSSVGYEVYSLYSRGEDIFAAVFTNVSVYPGSENPHFPGPFARKIFDMIK